MPVYATIDNYTDYVGVAVPEFSPRLMARASMVIDKALVGAIYPTDPTTNLPLGTDVNGVALADVFRDATCAQARTLVEDWEDWPTPVGCCPDCQLTAEAFDVLRGAGLIPITLRMLG